MTEQRNSGRVSRGRAFLDTLNGAGGASQAERPGGVSSAGHLGRDSTSHAAMRRPQSPATPKHAIRRVWRCSIIFAVFKLQRG